jgi:hypothetical protein
MPRPKKTELTPFQKQAIADQMGGTLIGPTPITQEEKYNGYTGPETKTKTGKEAWMRVEPTPMNMSPLAGNKNTFPVSGVDSIFYHINYGKNQWREAVLRVDVGATPEFLAKAAETVDALNAAFPLPATGGINTWYNNNFTYACIAISSYPRLVKMLVSMAEVMVANPGEVIVGWGKQFANATIAEVADNPDGPSYMKWVSEQQGTDVIRIQAAYEAYQIARGAK